MLMGLINDKHGGSTEAKEIMCDQRTEEVIKTAVREVRIVSKS